MVKACVAFGNIPLLAVTVKLYVPIGTDGATVIIPFAELMLVPVGAPVNE